MMDKIDLGDGKFLIAKEFSETREEIMTRLFPFKVLIRCWSLLNFAEERHLDFYDKYDKYITGTGETTEDYVYFEDIPLTEDKKYLLNVGVADMSEVTCFSIIQKFDNN